MTTTALNGVAPLSQLGVIRVEGPEAANFLHGQLTQDFAALGAAEARLAALCNAKGRMIASFIGIRPRPELILLSCSRDLLAATLKRLKMYVLRAKVQLSDATDDFALFGLIGDALTANGLDPAALAGQCRQFGDANAVALYPADGVPRALWIAPVDAPTPTGDALAPALWAASEVRSGIVTLSAPVVEAFVPQMLNYESVGGVNFKKGCYPGQEIVARSQFRGAIKRRGYLVRADGPIEVGQEVFAGSAPDGEPVGMVAQVAPGPDGRYDAMVSLQIKSLDGGDLHAGNAQGPLLTLEPLPYPLLEDI